MGCCSGFARCVLVTFNILFILTGIFVLGVGIFLKVNPNLLNIQHVIELNSQDKYISTAAYILIGFGIFVLFVGLFGFIGGLKQLKFFLCLYMGCVIIVFIGEFSAGITAAVYKGKVNDALKRIMTESLEQYDTKNKTSEIINKGWDGIQGWLHCCGVDGYKDYSTLNVTLDQNRVVPPSCCSSNTNECEKEAKNPPASKKFKYLYSEGCYDKMNETIKSHITLVIGAGIGVAMFQLLGIFLACAAWKRNEDDDYD